MSNIGSLVVDLKADTNKFVAGMNKANKRLDNFERKIKGATRVIAGMLGAGVMGALIKSQINAADNIQKLSIRLGESTEALSQYSHVADITGVSFEDVANAFSKMQKNLGDAKDGIGLALPALEKLKINVDDIIKLRPSEQFEAIADAIKTIEDPAIRTQVAMGLMGRSGSRMLSTMAEGGDGIRKLREEFDRMGGTLSKVDADQLAATNDSLTRMADRFEIAAKSATIAFGPAINAVAMEVSNAFGVITSFNEQLKLFFATHSYDDIGALRNELNALYKERETAEKNLFALYEKSNVENRNERIIQQEQNLLNVLNEQITAMEIKAGIAKERLSIGIEEGVETTEAEKLAQHEFNIRENERAIAAVKKQYRDREAAEVKVHSDKLVSFEQARTNSIIGLAAALGQKSKAFAIAAFAAEKVIAIQRIIISTNVAAAAALTPPPIGLGPVAGVGLAASIKSAGYATAGLVAATSIAQGINTFGGGGSAGIGGGASSSFDTGSTSSPETLQQREAVQQPQPIIIYFGEDDAEKVVKFGAPLAFKNDSLVLETADGLNLIRVAER